MEERYISYSAGRIVRFINDIMIHHTDLNNFKSRMQTIAHGVQVDYFKEQTSTFFGYKSKHKNKSTNIMVKINDLSKLNKASRKLFNIALMKMTETSLCHGAIKDIEVSIPFEEIVSSGFYSSIGGARKWFKNSAPALVNNIGFVGEIKLNRKSVFQGDIKYIFTDFRIKNNTGYLTLNNEIDYEILYLQYAKVPYLSYMRLKNGADDLLLYILQYARQNVKKLNTEKRTLNLKLKTLALRLDLPLYKNSRNPRRDIINRIISYTDSINAYMNDIEIKFSFSTDEDNMKSIKIYESGYMIISFSENYISMIKQRKCNKS